MRRGRPDLGISDGMCTQHFIVVILDHSPSFSDWNWWRLSSPVRHTVSARYRVLRKSSLSVYAQSSWHSFESGEKNIAICKADSSLWFHISSEQTAGVFTKALPTDSFKHLYSLNLIEAPSLRLQRNNRLYPTQIKVVTEITHSYDLWYIYIYLSCKVYF